MAILEGNNPREKLEKSYFPGLKANWMLWPAGKPPQTPQAIIVSNLLHVLLLQLADDYICCSSIFQFHTGAT